MVPDGYYYALTLVFAAVLLGWLVGAFWALPALVLAAFFLWFFRDPERAIPDTPGAVVSPADGKVTGIWPVTENGVRQTRISIFLNVFDVHVNRSPIAGIIREVRYQTGKVRNAMNLTSADQYVRMIVKVEEEGVRVSHKISERLLRSKI